MKVIEMKTAVMVTDKIQSILMGDDKKSIKVLMDCGGMNNFIYDTEKICKHDFDGMVKLLKEHLEGGDKK